ncbi:hypothetical protein BDZ45DRAFT_374367 [Acephala macrosclerotiorum]|nr:hypothetical protein BDZ45DRAFT_374367 [Acephala macrosclerotiorum]
MQCLSRISVNAGMSQLVSSRWGNCRFGAWLLVYGSGGFVLCCWWDWIGTRIRFWRFWTGLWCGCGTGGVSCVRDVSLVVDPEFCVVLGFDGTGVRVRCVGCRVSVVLAYMNEGSPFSFSFIYLVERFLRFVPVFTFIFKVDLLGARFEYPSAEQIRSRSEIRFFYRLIIHIHPLSPSSKNSET